MIDAGFDFSRLDTFSRNLILVAQRENPKLMRQFMRKEGTKLRSLTAKKAKSAVKKRSGKYHSSIKRGKPYKYGEDDAIRVYSTAPHAHLIEDGHRVKSHGREVGFSPGKHVFQEASREFTPTFERDTNELIDQIARSIGK